jgi:Ca2+-binding EF-hand superfamily protein
MTDEQGAKSIARRMMEQYDRNRDNTIDRTESVTMLVDTYRTFNKPVNPTSQDIDGFYKVLDRNRDGRITLQDLESLCIRYLVGGKPSSKEESLNNSHHSNTHYDNKTGTY